VHFAQPRAEPLESPATTGRRRVSVRMQRTSGLDVFCRPHNPGVQYGALEKRLLEAHLREPAGRQQIPKLPTLRVLIASGSGSRIRQLTACVLRQPRAPDPIPLPQEEREDDI
jgi:hypothetical protein